MRLRTRQFRNFTITERAEYFSDGRDSTFTPKIRITVPHKKKRRGYKTQCRARGRETCDYQAGWRPRDQPRRETMERRYPAIFALRRSWSVSLSHPRLRDRDGKGSYHRH